MPCPYFEPLWPAGSPAYADARLPLIQEYDGSCHATDPISAAPSDLRFRCCNHGYSRGECSRFPQAEPLSALRYHVVRRTPDAVELLCIEEIDHRPGRHFRFVYDVRAALLQPTAVNQRLQAQALAFCRSYIQRFCATEIAI